MSLKCCLPNGIPTMVRHNKIPKTRCVKTTQMPPKISQMIFIRVDKQPVLLAVSVILTPNGARPTKANLKHCKPNGIPTMVRQRINPPSIYSRKIKNPPKTIQMRLPIKFILLFIVRHTNQKLVTQEDSFQGANNSNSGSPSITKMTFLRVS